MNRIRSLGQNNTIIEYFITKFQKIDKSKWGIKVFDMNGKKCAYGHCLSIREQEQLGNLFNSFGKDVVKINDGEDLDFDQDNPKDRILAALNTFKLEVI